MRLSGSRQIHPLTFEIHSGWHHIIRRMGHMARSQHQHRIKVYTTQVFRSMIMRGVDLNMTLAGPGGHRGIGHLRSPLNMPTGQKANWGPARRFVDRVVPGGAGGFTVGVSRRSPSRLGPGDRSVAPFLDSVAAVRLGRGHHGGLSGVTPGSSCSRTRGHAGWSGFSSGERADPSCVFAVGLFWFAWPVGWW